MSSSVQYLSPDPDQIRELELLHREYQAQMMVSCDPQERRRLYAIAKQLEACIADMKKRLSS